MTNGGILDDNRLTFIIWKWYTEDGKGCWLKKKKYSLKRRANGCVTSLETVNKIQLEYFNNNP